MRQALDDWVKRTGDKGMQPEDDEALKQFLDDRRRRGRLKYDKFDFLK